MTGHSRMLWSLTFAWTALSGFQSTGIPFFAQAAFSGFWLAECIVFFICISLINLAGLCSCVVFSDYVHIHWVRRIVTVHSSKCFHTARRCLFDRTWFVAGIHVRCPKCFRWRYALGYLAFLRDSLNLDLTSQDQLDTMLCPLIMKGLSLVNGQVGLLRVLRSVDA